MFFRKPTTYAKLILKGFTERTELTRTWIEDHSPILVDLRKNLEMRIPFIGLKIGVCLPGTWEAFMLLSALEAGGASIFFHPMFSKPKVGKELLKKTSVKFVRSKDYRKVVKESDFLYDANASFGETVTKEETETKGIIEQTSSGVKTYRSYDNRGLLSQPVFDLDGAYIKKVRENKFAVGLGLVEALLKLHLFLPEKRILVVGFGNVGSGCALQLKRIGCKVDVYDVNPYKMLEADVLGYQTGSMHELLPLADIVISATGSSEPALGPKELGLMKTGAILANMGGIGWDRKEFHDKKTQKVGDGISKIFLDDDMYLYELAQGYPVNLVLAAGTDTETMDKVFSLGILTMECLVKNHASLPKHLLPVPEEVQRKHLALVSKYVRRKH